MSAFAENRQQRDRYFLSGEIPEPGVTGRSQSDSSSIYVDYPKISTARIPITLLDRSSRHINDDYSGNQASSPTNTSPR
jgi:hypothetical protein